MNFEEEIEDISKEAIKRNLINDEDPTLQILNLDALLEKVKELKTSFENAFKGETEFAFAIKSNPLTNVLKLLKKEGLSGECASYGEVCQCLKVGFNPENIQFDSPCKTIPELKLSLEKGVSINCDNLDEVERINEILSENPEILKKRSCKSHIGIRINPQIGYGKFDMTSTASKSSHFGIAYDTFYDKLSPIFNKYKWLNGLHCHVGSQGCSLELLVNGVKSLYVLCEKINNEIENKNQIKVIDIGGGIPINYESEKELFSYKEYVELIKKEVPDILNGKYKIITEYGRSMIAKYGFTLSKIEYVKNNKDNNIIMSHVGSNLMDRTTLQPEIWKYRISVLNKDGSMKKEENHKIYKIAGPLCFSGDIIGYERELSECYSGDYILIYDTGGYTYSMYNRYNSIKAPPYYGVKRLSDECYEFVCLKKGESYEKTIEFWDE